MTGWEAFPEEETHKLSLKGSVEFSQVKKDRRRAPQEGEGGVDGRNRRPWALMILKHYVCNRLRDDMKPGRGTSASSWSTIDHGLESVHHGAF